MNNQKEDDWNEKIKSVVTKIFYSVATNGQAEASINAGINDVKSLLAEYSSTPSEQGSDGWISVEDQLPVRPEKKIYQNVQCGYFTRKRSFIQFVGFYAEKHKVPFEDYDNDDHEYDPVEEAHGTMYLKEGWYELEETPGGQYDEVFVSRKVTHWRHLFTPPQSKE